MRLWRFKDRRKLQQRIGKYKDRREEMRKKYGFVNGGRGGWTVPDEYRIASDNINRKIGNWNHQIRVMDERNDRLKRIGRALKEFSGFEAKDSIRYTARKNIVYRQIFYKYCLENNISATLIAEYVGASRGDIVARGRLMFNKSFESHPGNREKWNNFKQFFLEFQE